ncbi:hypothetical protein [Agrococcus baldri]|uniref:hypothetical protein n=1 Tax=Agrococcus baldri TaxID=153730 RepID=UPI0011BF63F1|nr:hypothetical protein [Agrococcus baldri]
MDKFTDWVWPKRWQKVAWWICLTYIAIAGVYFALRVANDVPLFMLDWGIAGSILGVASLMVWLDSVRRRSGSNSSPGDLVSTPDSHDSSMKVPEWKWPRAWQTLLWWVGVIYLSAAVTFAVWTLLFSPNAPVASGWWLLATTIPALCLLIWLDRIRRAS